MNGLRHASGALAVLFALLASVSTARAAATATVSGKVTDTAGSPIAGAAVALRGPQKYATTTDAGGAFSLAQIAPGTYALSVVKSGFNAASQSGITLAPGQSTSFAVHLGRLTFSSLQTIATVVSEGVRTINTSPASVYVVNAQDFLDQAQPQVTRVLSQVPGVQISFPSTSANAAAPGSITVPNIRNATSYETASLIDGHPISVGQYGDNVTTFLNSFMFGNIEVVKGPGAESPVVNNAIGGTLNFRTKDPPLQPTANFLVALDNRGGGYGNFEFAGTIGKLGYVLDWATYNNPSALNRQQVYYDPSGTGSIHGKTLQGNATSSTVPGTSSSITTGYPLLACCYTLYGFLNQNAQLAKVTYRFSPATVVTVSYLGSQSTSDQNGNTSDFTNAFFTPGAKYHGSLQSGPIQVASIFPGAFSGEYNIEPIFQAQLATTIGDDTLLARWYHASILRYQFQGGSPTALDYNFVNLFGTSYGKGNLDHTFQGGVENVGYNDFYQEPELDKLAGGSFEYQHPIGDGALTFSADRTVAQSVDYSVFGGPFYSFNLPPGTWQMLTTYRLGGHFYVGPKLDATLTDYESTYNSTYPVACAGGNCSTQSAAMYGTGVTLRTTKNAHNDPRIGLVYRPNRATAIRFAAGSAIAPPFLGLLNQITSTPSYDSADHVAIEQVSNGSLKPETAFGYDLGADLRINRDTLFTGDVYLTDLYNRFFGQTLATGKVCNAVNVCTGGAPFGTPILNQTNINISNARFEGIELSVRSAPPLGFGYSVSGSLQRGYYYALPPFFYCSIPRPGCSANQNLNIIEGENTNGDGIGVGGLSYNGNMRIPYSEGNAQLWYTFKNGAYAMFGETYYGYNNSLNEPAFGIGYATLRYPLNPRLSLQVSGDNVFNAYPGYLPIYGGGVAIPLYGNQTAATVGNVLGPATYRFVLSSSLP